MLLTEITAICMHAPACAVVTVTLELLVHPAMVHAWTVKVYVVYGSRFNASVDSEVQPHIRHSRGAEWPSLQHNVVDDDSIRLRRHRPVDVDRGGRDSGNGGGPHTGRS